MPNQGFVSAVSHIRSFVPAVYDCTLTVRNNQPKPTLLRMFSGQSSEVTTDNNASFLFSHINKMFEHLSETFCFFFLEVEFAAKTSQDEWLARNWWWYCSMVPRSIYHQGSQTNFLNWNKTSFVSTLLTFNNQDAQLETYFTKDVFSDLDVHQINRPIKPLIVRNMTNITAKWYYIDFSHETCCYCWKQVVIVWVCLLMYGGFKLLQWLSMVASWEIICLFVVILVIATITMQVLIQSSESHRSTPAKRPLQEQLISA